MDSILRILQMCMKNQLYVLIFCLWSLWMKVSNTNFFSNSVIQINCSPSPWANVQGSTLQGWETWKSAQILYMPEKKSFREGRFRTLIQFCLDFFFNASWFIAQEEQDLKTNPFSPSFCLFKHLSHTRRKS